MNALRKNVCGIPVVTEADLLKGSARPVKPRVQRLKGQIRDLLQELLLDPQATVDEPIDFLRTMLLEARSLAASLLADGEARARRADAHEPREPHQFFYELSLQPGLCNVPSYVTLALNQIPELS